MTTHNEYEQESTEELSNPQSNILSRREFLFLTGSALVLSACGGDQDPTPTAEPATTTPTATIVPAATAEATIVPTVEAQLITPEYLEAIVSQEYTDFIERYAELEVDQNGRERMRIITDESTGATVSEGVAYAMLMTARRSDWTNFEKLFNYVLDYTYSIDPYDPSAGLSNKIQRLMPWRIKADGEIDGDMSSATDADVDMAYALTLGTQFYPQYEPFAKDFILEIARTSIDPETFVLKPGNDWGGPERTNPSYFDPGYFAKLGNFLSDLEVDVSEKESMTSAANTIWSAVQVFYDIYSRIREKPENTTGLIPEWCDINGDAYSEEHNKCHDDGLRIAWRLSHDLSDAVSIEHLKEINAFFEESVAAANGDFSVLKDAYLLNGEIVGEWHNSIIRSAVALASIESDDINYRLRAIADLIAIKENRYYNDALRLLALMEIKDIPWLDLGS